MIKIYLILFSIAFSVVLNAQISKDDQAEITRMAGGNLLQLRVWPSYPYTSINDRCNVQPSLTVKNDTTGVYFNNEYLLFRSPIHYKQGKEVMKLMQMQYVTVAEYFAFQNDVRDSIAREKLYQCFDDRESNLWIMFDEKYMDPKTKKLADPSNREYNRELFALNRKKAVDYTADKYVACFVDMYLPQPERMNKMRLFDERKLIYRYTDIYEQFASMSKEEITALFPNFYNYGSNATKVEHNVSTLTDPYRWSTASKFDRDEYSVLGQLYNQLLPNEPVIGITGMQANAFCHWKQEQLQREIDSKKLKYTVIVTLPAFEDLPSGVQPKLAIPERDYTEQWNITVQEYEHFVAYTKDSVLREALYAALSKNDAVRLLDYNPKAEYFDEGWLEYRLLDTFEREINRYYFPLNYKVKIQKFGAVTDSIMQSATYTNPHYHYENFDAFQRTIIGKLDVDRRRYNFARDRDTMNLDPTEIGEDGEWIGKDMSLDYFNRLNQSYGVRYYENLQRLIHIDSVAVLPAANDGNTDPKSLMKGISYAQAIAFYYWKYPLHKRKSGATWQDFVLPSEAQFEKIQRGERILVPKREMEYPAPLFRYVVHVYPK